MIMLLLVFLATSLTSVSSLLPKSLNSAWLPTSISFKHTPTSADCRLSYFTQPLDHFNTTNSKTFQQRYFWNATYFKPNGPILYYTGNEADVTLYVNATGLMWENAEELGALLVFGEHRYYGETLPFDPPFAPAQLKWLSVEQSLADHVRLVKHIKKTITGAENSKVVAIGGSYGGMQSSWIRMRYPNIIDGAIAASAPILAFDGVSKENAKRAGAESYWKIVTDDATEAFGSTANCASNVRRSWMAMDKMFSTGHEGKKKLQTLFSLCKEPSTLVELVALKTYLQMAFDTMAMGNFPFPSSYLASGVAVLPAYPFRKACSYLGNKNDTDDALLRNLGVAAAVFNNATLKLQCFELPLDPDYDGIWDYMWCTDTLCQETYFGRNGVDDMFWSFQYDEHAINVHCKMKYGITPSYYNIKEQFGGIDGVRNSSNIVFSNGRFDPWRSGGVTSINSTERSIWSIVIPNGAHHVDLMFSTNVDPPDLGIAREFELNKIKEWVNWEGGDNENEKEKESSPIYPNVSTVHVINSCHLDIGFKDSSLNIINLYFDHHLPMASQVGKELRRNTKSGFTDVKLNFMFQSWVISMFFDCPPNLGLHCPNATSKENIRSAIDAGDITWHAFPHNAQLEIMGETFLHAGLQMTRDVDAMFSNQPMKRTLSQRDVPGMPRGIIPLLNKSGVSAISIGANDGSTPPKLPKAFVWKDSTSKTSLLGLFNWPGYGHLGEEVVLPNLKHALVYNWNGDNDGPYTASDYIQKWKAIQTMFPNANIYASTFDNFTKHLNEVRNELPVIEADVGDTWIYGVPSDPQKVARALAMERVWKAVGNNTKNTDLILKNATRWALLLGSHTDGKDVKTFLKDNYSWDNQKFHKARKNGINASQYATLENSWWEQREWGISIAMDTLKDGAHPMYNMIMQEFNDLKPIQPELSKKATSTTFDCNGATVEFNSEGSLSGLIDGESGKHWSDKNHPLVSLKYRTYSTSDVRHFFSTYCKSKADWVHRDYGKPGLPNSTIGRIWSPTLNSLYIVDEMEKSEKEMVTCSYVAHSTFDETAWNDYGAVKNVWINYTINVNSNGGFEMIDVVVGLFNKTATRLPESMFVQFHPILSDENWLAQTLGSWSSPEHVLDGGSKHLFGSQVVKSSGLTITSHDSIVASFGELNGYPIPTNSTPDVTDFGVSFIMWDNLWGTNYVQWWPFVVPPPEPYTTSTEYFPVNGNADFSARFEMKFE